MVLVHVGLPKTATTFLQKHVFPDLARGLGATYNDPAILRTLARAALFPLSEAEVAQVRERTATGDHVISLESLAGWNPVLWEERAAQNRALFGPEARILLTLRDPVDWMTSLYQEMVHEGNVIPPQDFFVTAATWALATRLTTPWRLDYLNADAVDFRALHRAYADRFDHVIATGIEGLRDMSAFDGHLDLDEGLKRALRGKMTGKRRLHRAYSAPAMAMTLGYERMLRVVRLTTLGSNARRLGHYRHLLTAEELGRPVPAPPEGPPGPGRRVAAYLAPRLIPRWGGFIKDIFDRVIPYRPYRLPGDVYLNPDLVAANRAFLAELRRDAAG